MYIRLLLILFIISTVLIINCGDDTVNNSNGNGNNNDPGILMTDEFGNSLGGDTTDWCVNGSGGFKLYAAYPNPTNGSVVHVRFDIPAADTVKLYFLNSPGDSTVFFGGPVMAGSYMVTINDSTNQFANSYRRLHFSSKQLSPSQYCRFYGDIKFTP